MESFPLPRAYFTVGKQAAVVSSFLLHLACNIACVCRHPEKYHTAVALAAPRIAVAAVAAIAVVAAAIAGLSAPLCPPRLSYAH